MHITQFIPAISIAALLSGCAATVLPPLPSNNPADPQVRSRSKFPQLLTPDDTTLAIERELSATADIAKSAESMQHGMHDMHGMQHGGMRHEGMKQGGEIEAQKKTLADQMKETSDEMKATSDALKQKSEEMKSGAVIYTCPMHPEVQSDKPGKCPKCGMTLVRKEAAHESH